MFLFWGLMASLIMPLQPTAVLGLLEPLWPCVFLRFPCILRHIWNSNARGGQLIPLGPFVVRLRRTAQLRLRRCALRLSSGS